MKSQDHELSFRITDRRQENKDLNYVVQGLFLQKTPFFGECIMAGNKGNGTVSAPSFNATAAAELIQAQVVAAQTERTALTAQLDALNAQIEGVDAFIALHSGKPARKARGSARKANAPAGTRDAWGVRGRVLQALAQATEPANAASVAEAMVRNGYASSPSLASSVAQQFTKLSADSLIGTKERGLYSINATGRKELVKIEKDIADATAAASAAAAVVA